MRERGELHWSHLEQFKTWLTRQGWMEEPKKGVFEVCRFRHPQHARPLIVHQRAHAPEHCVIWGDSLRWYQRWRRERSAPGPEGGK